jgi:hypothetical protein
MTMHRAIDHALTRQMVKEVEHSPTGMDIQTPTARDPYCRPLIPVRGPAPAGRSSP